MRALAGVRGVTWCSGPGARTWSSRPEDAVRGGD